MSIHMSQIHETLAEARLRHRQLRDHHHRVAENVARARDAAQAAAAIRDGTPLSGEAGGVEGTRPPLGAPRP